MTVTIRHGDCREVLRTLPDESVHCCVTSPPYFGLRDYGTAKWDGGAPDCDHAGSVSRTAPPGTAKQASNQGASHVRSGDCKCGARRVDSQIGLEQTPDAYVAELVAVFREVRRVLRDDGTLWLNLGDSYATSSKTTGRNDGDFNERTQERYGKYSAKHGYATDQPKARVNISHGLKSKDLIGIPWRVAFALQADGWYLRQDIIWHKPNPMPESVRDRCTKAHEYLFLLSKSPKYFYDADAISEALAGKPHSPGNKASGRIGSNGGTDNCVHQSDRVWGLSGKRNKRSVWEVTTQPFSEAHFATFPPDLVEPCIQAGCPVGGTVLDPFGGAGTTGLVADRLKRDAILIELNPQYAAMAERRIKGDAPLFADVASI